MSSQLEWLSKKKKEKEKTTNACEDAGENEPSHTFGRNVDEYNHHRRQYGGGSKD
jgi:hypothetical protein